MVLNVKDYCEKQWPFVIGKKSTNYNIEKGEVAMSNRDVSPFVVLFAIPAFAVLSDAAWTAPCTPGVNSDADGSTCIGSIALGANTTGRTNTAVGLQAMRNNTTGSANTANGAEALATNVSGIGNTAIGQGAMYGNVSGGQNTSIGTSSLRKSSGGSGNTAVGARALFSNTTGGNNIAVGYNAGQNITTGSSNIAIGNVGNAADSGTVRIGTSGEHTQTFIAGVLGTVITSGQPVMIDSNGKLGVTASSARYKQDVQAMGDASIPLAKLRPVTFRYAQAESDGSRPIRYGLIAEEVAQVMPELVISNASGVAQSVAYDALPSLLLNEYQKQSARLAAVEAELAALRSMVDRLAKGTK